VANLGGDPRARCCELSFGQVSVLCLPLRHRGQSVTDEQSPTCCACHPGGDTHAFGGGGIDYTFVDVGIDGDGQLW